jgi:SAM-dependent methyltransferase
MTTNPKARQSFNPLDRIIRQARSRRLRKYLSSPDVVLDYGCGEANWFLRANQGLFSKGVGIDPALHAPSPESSFNGESVLGFKQTLQEYLLQNNTMRFSKVFWIAVVEHHEPYEAQESLRLCAQHLEEQGRIVLTTPTPRAKPILEFMAFRLKIISAEEIRDHRLYYNQSSMTQLLESIGLEVEKYETFQFGLNSLTIARKAA